MTASTAPTVPSAVNGGGGVTLLTSTLPALRTAVRDLRMRVRRSNTTGPPPSASTTRNEPDNGSSSKNASKADRPALICSRQDEDPATMLAWITTFLARSAVSSNTAKKQSSEPENSS